MERIKLNLIPSGVAPVVHVSQYDEGREFACDLFEGANVYTLDGTETLTVQVRKPDGHLVTESVTNTSDSYIVVTTTEQMCAVHGTNLANLKIEKGSVEIASLNFLMEVERDPLENGDPSESFVDNLNTQIYNAVADQYDSNNVIFDNAPTAGHNQPYTVTSDGIKSTIDNLELDDLHDVTISGAVSGEALTWDGSKWVNGTVSTVGSIDDLNDVDTTGKVDNSSLVYNSNDSEWQAKKLTVTLTQAEYDQLKLDGDLVEGTNYIITDGQNVTCDLGDLDDVTISGSPSGNYLKNVSGTWQDTSLATVAESGSYSDLSGRIYYESLTFTITPLVWASPIYYCDFQLTTTYSIADADSIMVQSESNQLWVVSSGKVSDNKISGRVALLTSATQNNVKFKVYYKVA